MSNIEIRIKRGTSAYLAELNPVLDVGEPCLETDTNKVKYGDGTTPYNLLAYASGADASGTNNTITGTDGFIGGGNTNNVSSLNGFVGAGNNNSVNGANAGIIAGSNNTASGQNASVIGGSNNIASAINSAALGQFNSAAGDFSFAVGKYSRTTKPGQLAMSSGKFDSLGDAQSSTFQMRTKTIGSVTSYFSIDGQDFPNGSYLNISVGSTWNFEIKVTAYDSTNDASAEWTVKGGVKRSFGGTTSLMGLPIIDSSGESAWGSADISVYANSTDQDLPNTLILAATGSNGSTIYWNASITTVELSPQPPLTSDMFVEIPVNSAISTLSVTIQNSSGSLLPQFNPNIHDYCIYSANNATDNYSITINGSTTSGTINVNKALHVSYGSQHYFIRVIPTDLPLPTLVTKTSGHRPGYYLYNPSQANGAQYFIVSDENLVPVWYAHDPLYSGFALHYGGTPNKLVFHRWAGQPRQAVTLGINSMSVVSYNMKNDSTNSNPFWECHESHVIAGPANRKGNFISMTYAYGCGGTYMPGNGVYIQELTPDGQTVVWDWHSNDYFDISQHYDYFHCNSIDVHPETGNLLLSTRHTGGGFCIDYQTKQVLWILQGSPCCSDTGQFSSVARPGMLNNTKYLTITGDPYGPPSGNHDARWHSNIAPLTPGNQVVSFYDDRTNGGYARGVVYEIDLVNNRAIFRCHAHSETGSSPMQGGFTLVKENDGSYSHVATFYGNSPCLVEYNGGGTSLDPQQNVVFSVNMYNSGNFYRIVKVRKDQLDINHMRTTAGRPLSF